MENVTHYTSKCRKWGDKKLRTLHTRVDYYKIKSVDKNQTNQGVIGSRGDKHTDVRRTVLFPGTQLSLS